MKRRLKKYFTPIFLMLSGMGIIVWFNWQLLVGLLCVFIGAYLWELHNPRPKQ